MKFKKIIIIIVSQPEQCYEQTFALYPWPSRGLLLLLLFKLVNYVFSSEIQSMNHCLVEIRFANIHIAGKLSYR